MLSACAKLAIRRAKRETPIALVIGQTPTWRAVMRVTAHTRATAACELEAVNGLLLVSLTPR